MARTPTQVDTADIAIIGMAGRFPGANDLDAFWQGLESGSELVSFFSDQDLLPSGITSAVVNAPNYVRARGILEGAELFDASFFGFTPREAELMDPQHRVFLECAWEALENSGYDPEKYDGLIGIYAGTSMNTYLLSSLYPNLDQAEPADRSIVFTSDKDFLTTNVSYKLNLKGPSIAVQTFCSTSLVAVHLARQSLLNDECDMALAGGVSINVPQKAGYIYKEGSILSADGHVRTFDAKANGTVFSNGVGVIVLKRLVDALADGDYVHAVIKGSAVNNDGALKVGFTAPSVDGQAEVIVEALADAGINPETIQYIEAHGTGTTLGDPIEVAALTKAFGTYTQRKGFCGIGSVKTNIGHMDAAAGIAGLIKTVLALEHKQIPASLHFEQPNPKIDFADSPFYVNTELVDWKTEGGPRRGGVSSLGFGGTNAHVILEEAPQSEESKAARPWQVLVLSAKTPTALETATDRLVTHLKLHPHLQLADVAYTLQTGRKAFNYRRALSCQSVEDAIQALEHRDPHRLHTNTLEQRNCPVVFLFPGQGAQHVGMGRQVYQSEPIFQAQVDQCCELLIPHLGLDLRDVLYAEGEQTKAAQEQLNQTRLSQPALFVIEYALARLWMAWGVQPQAMLGHSIGEYVAACLAGVFSLQDGLGLVAERGRLMQSMPTGAMLSVFLPEADVCPRLGEGLSLAAVNGPSQCVVSGLPQAVNELEHHLEQDQVNCRRLHTSHAFHSAMMEPIVPEFTQHMKTIHLNPPQIPYISNLTGAWIMPEEATGSIYWSRHLRETVQFADGVRTLLQASRRLFLEVGPGQTLSNLILGQFDLPQDAMAAYSLPHPKDVRPDYASIFDALGQLWLAGAQVDWASMCGAGRRRRIPLPTYPFERQRYWIDPPALADGDVAASKLVSNPLTKKADITDWFYAPVWKQSTPRQMHISLVETNSPKQWLMFGDRWGIGDRLATRLRQAGHRVVIVKASEKFTRVNHDQYTLNPHQHKDYGALLESLNHEGYLIDRIVHLWSITPVRPDAADRIRDIQSLGVYSLIYLAQALGVHSHDRTIHIDVVSNNIYCVTGEEDVYPEKATILGPCRVIPQEYPNLTCRSIDIQLPSKIWAEEKLTAQLDAELVHTTGDRIVAYRGPYRWIQIFEAMDLEPPTGLPSLLREGGVYLITGGLGGMGLTIAGYLARKAHARLVLIGRSTLPAKADWAEWLLTHDRQDETSRKIRQVKALEDAGAQVLVIKADVTDVVQMQVAVGQACEQFGGIHGVIHAAGIAGEGVIQLKTQKVAARVLAPKLEGTLTLENAIKGTRLDFIVLCSSVASIIGGVGQVDYCAANAFLDAFAHSHSVQSQTPVISINWDAWQHVGMAVQAAISEGLKARLIRQVDHPFLDYCILENDDQEVYLTEFSVDKHWVLDEHRVNGNALIPGVTYLEMVRAAFEKHAQGNPIELHDVLFVTPLFVSDDEQKYVYTILRKSESSYDFRIISRYELETQETRWQEHAVGKVAVGRPELPQRRSLEMILERCSTNIDMTEGDGTSPMRFGPRWKNIRQIRAGTAEAVAILELSEEFSTDSAFKLHPSLMDMATSFTGGYAEGLYLPLSYGRVKVKSSLPRRINSYVQHRHHDSQQETVTLDIVLLDEQGMELVEIEAFIMKKVNSIGALVGEEYRQVSTGFTVTGSEAYYEETVGKSYLHTSLAGGILPKEGIEALERVLSMSASAQIVVTPGNLQALQARSQSGSVLERAGKVYLSEPLLARSVRPRPNLRTPYEAPRNELEKSIIHIWQKLLAVEQVGIDDNFFELGGNSLMSIQFVSQLKEKLKDVPIPLVSLYESPTIRSLVESLAKSPESGAKAEGRGEQVRQRKAYQSKQRAKRDKLVSDTETEREV